MAHTMSPKAAALAALMLFTMMPIPLLQASPDPPCPASPGGFCLPDVPDESCLEPPLPAVDAALRCAAPLQDTDWIFDDLDHAGPYAEWIARSELEYAREQASEQTAYLVCDVVYSQAPGCPDGPLSLLAYCEILLLPQAVSSSTPADSCPAINCSLLGLTAFVAVVALGEVTTTASGACLDDEHPAGTGLLSALQPGDDEWDGYLQASASGPAGIDSARAAAGGTFVCQASTPAGTGLGGLAICMVSFI